MYDSHMHTPLCKHAVGSPDTYAAMAKERGLRGIVFTCHNPLPRGLSASVRMAPEQFDHYLSLIADTRRQWGAQVDVRLGLECDFLPGENVESWLEQQTRAANFDYLLASIHPHLPEYRTRFWQGDPVAYQRVYFEHLAEAAEWRLHDCLAHPDLVKNTCPEEWRVDRLLDHVRRCLDRIAHTGLAMELNTSGWNKPAAEQNPGLVILREMSVRQIPVVLGSDAHEPGRVGDRFLKALDLLEKAGFEEVSYYLCRRRHEAAIAEVRETLMAGRASSGVGVREVVPSHLSASADTPGGRASGRTTSPISTIS